MVKVYSLLLLWVAFFVPSIQAQESGRYRSETNQAKEDPSGPIQALQAYIVELYAELEKANVDFRTYQNTSQQEIAELKRDVLYVKAEMGRTISEKEYKYVVLVRSNRLVKEENERLKIINEKLKNKSGYQDVKSTNEVQLTNKLAQLITQKDKLTKVLTAANTEKLRLEIESRDLKIRTEKEKEILRREVVLAKKEKEELEVSIYEKYLKRESVNKELIQEDKILQSQNENLRIQLESEGGNTAQLRIQLDAVTTEKDSVARMLAAETAEKLRLEKIFRYLTIRTEKEEVITQKEISILKIEKKQIEIKMLQRISQKEQLNQQLVQQKKALQGRLEQLENINQKLTARLNASQLESSSKGQRIRTLSIREESLITQLKTIKAERFRLQSEKESLKAKLMEEKKVLTQQLGALKREKSNSESTLKGVISQNEYLNSKLFAENKITEERNKSLEAKNKDVNARFIKLQSRYNNKKQVLTDVVAREKGLKVELEETRAEKTLLAVENGSLWDKTEEETKLLKAKNNDLAPQLISLNSQLKISKAAQLSASSEIDSLKYEIDGLFQKLSILNTQNKIDREAFGKLQKQENQLKAQQADLEVRAQLLIGKENDLSQRTMEVKRSEAMYKQLLKKEMQLKLYEQQLLMQSN